MLNLIIILIFSLAISFFASENAISLPINLGPYAFTSIPLYVVVGLSILAGIIISWLASLLSSISTSMKLRRKDKSIAANKDTIHDMTKKINNLEIENSNLKGELNNDPTDEQSL